MFSEMVHGLAQGRLPAAGPLRQRFDMAMTKKMGIVRLPSAFWMQDPKINPLAAHLFWAALLLLDRPRIELALAVLAAEGAEEDRAFVPSAAVMAEEAHRLLQDLLAVIADPEIREELRRQLRLIVPEWLEPGYGGAESMGHGH